MKSEKVEGEMNWQFYAVHSNAGVIAGYFGEE